MTFVSTLDQHYFNEPWGRRKIEGFAATVRCSIRVAETSDRRIIGFIAAERTGIEPAQYEIHRLAVHPDFTGCDVGSSLVDCVKCLVRRSPSITLAVNVKPSQMEFFRQIGFKAIRLFRSFDLGSGDTELPIEGSEHYRMTLRHDRKRS